MIKQLGKVSIYEPGKRKWLKLKKDFVERLVILISFKSSVIDFLILISAFHSIAVCGTRLI